VPNWSAGDTIPLGRDRALRVVEIRAAVKKNPPQNYVSPFVDKSKIKLPTGPAPFPAGLNVGD
jgi:hypothetical protein